MNKVFISDIFASYQGEGLFVGEKHIFVRFSLCNLNCIYCDEKASKLKGSEFEIDKVISKIRKLSEKEYTNIISFTGGEPLLYSDAIKKIINSLGSNYKYLIETNGVLYKEMKKIINIVDIISMDIKLPQYCNKILWKEHYNFLQISEQKVYVKVVVGRDVKIKDFRKAVLLVSKVCNRIPFFIQPISSQSLSFDIEFFDKLYRVAREKLENIRFLPQIHKLLKIK
ncbi:MAG: 7-carboxy-7-deazaguanine synthase QueE [Elusimicrobiota bacterium]